jgi:hypothetical protein
MGLDSPRNYFFRQAVILEKINERRSLQTAQADTLVEI